MSDANYPLFETSRAALSRGGKGKDWKVDTIQHDFKTVRGETVKKGTQINSKYAYVLYSSYAICVDLKNMKDMKTGIKAKRWFNEKSKKFQCGTTAKFEKDCISVNIKMHDAIKYGENGRLVAACTAYQNMFKKYINVLEKQERKAIQEEAETPEALAKYHLSTCCRDVDALKAMSHQYTFLQTNTYVVSAKDNEDDENENENDNNDDENENENDNEKENENDDDKGEDTDVSESAKPSRGNLSSRLAKGTGGIPEEPDDRSDDGETNSSEDSDSSNEQTGDFPMQQPTYNQLNNQGNYRQWSDNSQYQNQNNQPNNQGTGAQFGASGYNAGLPVQQPVYNQQNIQYQNNQPDNQGNHGQWVQNPTAYNQGNNEQTNQSSQIPQNTQLNDLTFKRNFFASQEPNSQAGNNSQNIPYQNNQLNNQGNYRPWSDNYQYQNRNNQPNNQGTGAQFGASGYNVGSPAQQPVYNQQNFPYPNDQQNNQGNYWQLGQNHTAYNQWNNDQMNQSSQIPQNTQLNDLTFKRNFFASQEPNSQAGNNSQSIQYQYNQPNNQGNYDQMNQYPLDTKTNDMKYRVQNVDDGGGISSDDSDNYATNNLWQR